MRFNIVGTQSFGTVLLVEWLYVAPDGDTVIVVVQPAVSDGHHVFHRERDDSLSNLRFGDSSLELEDLIADALGDVIP